MDSLDQFVRPIAKAVADMHKHLALLREQFSKIYPKEQLVSKDGKYYEGWIVDALEFDLKKLEQALTAPPSGEEPSAGVR
jgi:hypothetical protein